MTQDAPKSDETNTGEPIDIKFGRNIYRLYRLRTEYGWLVKDFEANSLTWVLDLRHEWKVNDLGRYS